MTDFKNEPDISLFSQIVKTSASYHDASERLNDLNYTTATGKAWTSKLVQYRVYQNGDYNFSQIDQKRRVSFPWKNDVEYPKPKQLEVMVGVPFFDVCSQTNSLG